MRLRKIIRSTIREFLNENNYLDVTNRDLKDIYEVPVEFMWQYREFDRCGSDNLYGDEYIERLTKDIKENGIKRPITLQIDGGYGLIVEGNHRLCIAIKLGFATIPVKVVYNTFGSINKHRTKRIKFNPDKWRMGFWDDKLSSESIKHLAFSFIKNFELPYYEYKNKLNFEEFDKWVIGNEDVVNFLIGDISINNVEPYDNNQTLTKEILSIYKNKFNKVL